MEKNVPGVFRNPIDHQINNNKEMEYVKKEIEQKMVVTKEEQMKTDLFGGDTKRKIREIFNSPTYVYKANVEIITAKGKMIKKIVGRNKNELITIDNEVISIDEIIDIKVVS